MFDRYLIMESSLRTTAEGFEFDIRIPYYRGVALSTVETFEVTIDGKAVPEDAITFILRGREFTRAQREREGTMRWEFGETATLRAQWPSTLEAGEHTVSEMTQLRISYSDVPMRGRDQKRLMLERASR